MIGPTNFGTFALAMQHATLRQNQTMATSRQITVLVVDDDAVNRQLARSILENLYQVLEAPDGPSALALLAVESVDLVLLDVMMPRMHGFDVCRVIKGRSSEPYLPVILLTALHDQSDRTAGLEAGADEFLTKPFDRRELRLRVATFIRLRAQDQQIRAQVEHLQHLDQVKDDLVSLLIHDVRNPLAAAMAVVESADSGDNVQLSADLATLGRLHERIRRMLDDVLTVRSLEEGKIDAPFLRLSLNEPVRLAVQTCAPLAMDRGVTLCAYEDPTLPPVNGNLDLLRRAIENLLSNAIKYAPRGSVIELSQSALGRFARLTVADRGEGISANVRDVLFEKFGTSGQRCPDAPRGFGWGLYLVRLVASAHGGAVGAAPRAGGGTIVSLTLALDAQ